MMVVMVICVGRAGKRPLSLGFPSLGTSGGSLFIVGGNERRLRDRC